MDLEGQKLAGFVQKYRVWRGSRVLTVDIELDPVEEPKADPWNSYVCCRFAWGDETSELFRTVVLPAALPNIFTGLRIGLGLGWMALVAGELVAAPSGLGYLINNARTLFRSDYILLGMVLIGVLGLVLDYLMRQVARLVMPWHRGQ